MPDPLDPDRLVTIDEACELVRVSRHTIYNWIRAGTVKTIQLPNGRYRIVASSLINEEILSDVQHQAFSQLVIRVRATLAQRNRLMSAETVQLLEDTLTALESFTT